MIKKRYQNSNEFAALTDVQLEADIRRCKTMQSLSGTAVGRKAFAKRKLAGEQELQKRQEASRV
jgi:hypothetical protein